MRWTSSLPRPMFVGDRLAVDVADLKRSACGCVGRDPYRVEEDPEIRPDARIGRSENCSAAGGMGTRVGDPHPLILDIGRILGHR